GPTGKHIWTNVSGYLMTTATPGLPSHRVSATSSMCRQIPFNGTSRSNRHGMGHVLLKSRLSRTSGFFIHKECIYTCWMKTVLYRLKLEVMQFDRVVSYRSIEDRRNRLMCLFRFFDSIQGRKGIQHDQCHYLGYRRRHRTRTHRAWLEHVP